jgi:hypothetical protein
MKITGMLSQQMATAREFLGKANGNGMTARTPRRRFSVQHQLVQLLLSLPATSARLEVA